MGGQKKAPVRMVAQPGREGSVLLAHDARTGNACAVRLAKLRELGLAGATAVTLATIIWGGTDA